MAETTGFIDFTYHGETFKTWYNLVGEIKVGGPTPIVVLHGGPGCPNPYLDPHKDLHALLHGAPLIFYDQIGCGKSTHLQNKPSKFWNVELFKDELDNVLNHFGLSSSSFDILGHSWGGMLAAEYIVSRHPTGLRRLVLASAPASLELWFQSQNKLLQRMPVEAQKAVREFEKQGTVDDPEYKKWIMMFFSKHTCTIDPFPEDLQKSLGVFAEDPTVCNTLIGTRRFTIDGNLTTWSVVGKLAAITVPTLVTNGVEDATQDEAIQPFVEEIPDVEWVKFQNSSHTAYFEERDACMKVISDFLE